MKVRLSFSTLWRVKKDPKPKTCSASTQTHLKLSVVFLSPSTTQFRLMELGRCSVYAPANGPKQEMRRDLAAQFLMLALRLQYRVGVQSSSLEVRALR